MRRAGRVAGAQADATTDLSSERRGHAGQPGVDPQFLQQLQETEQLSGSCTILSQHGWTRNSNLI